MDRETLATTLVVVGAVLIPFGTYLIGGWPWATLAGGIEAVILGLATGWE
jgi:hypothetical protein